MQISCPSCAAQYSVDESKIPPQGVSITCPKCEHTFTVGVPPTTEVSNEVPLPGAGSPGGVPLPGAGSPGGVPLPGAGSPGGVPLPGAGSPGGVPLPGAGSPGGVPLPGAGATAPPAAAAPPNPAAPPAAAPPPAAGGVPLPGAGDAGGVPLPGAGAAGGVPLPGAGAAGGVPLPGAGAAGGAPLPGAGAAGGVPLPGAGAAGGVPLPGAGAAGGVPLPGAGAAGGVPLPGAGGGATPLPGSAPPGGSGVPLPGSAAPEADATEIFGNPGAANPSADLFGDGGSNAAPGAAAGMADIFGDLESGKNEASEGHPFHGTNSVVVAGGPAQKSDGLLDFISGGQNNEGDQVLYRIRKRSGRVTGPFDEGTVTQMFSRQELNGSEEVSVDGGVSWRPLAQTPPFADIVQRAMAEALGGLDGGADLPGLPTSNADLPGLPSQNADLPGLVDHGTDLPGLRQGGDGGGQALDPGADLSNLPTLADADAPGLGAPGTQPGAEAGGPKQKGKKAKRPAKSGGGGLSAGLMAGMGLLLLVIAGGVTLEFVTDWGYFGYKKVLALIESGGKTKAKTVDATPPPPPLPASDVKPEELFSRDTYVAYRQGAEQQQTIADQGFKLETPHPAARTAAGIQAQFLARLIVIEEMSVFDKELKQALERANRGLSKTIGTVATELSQKGGPAKALVRLKPFIGDPEARGHEFAVARLWQGLAYRAQRNDSEAEKAFDMALMAEPGNLAVTYQQGALLFDTGKSEAALGYAEKVLETSPDHPRALLLKAKVLVRDAKTLEEGARLLENIASGTQAKQAGPPQQAKAYVTLAEAAVAEREWAQALERMNKAVEKLPNDRKMRVAQGNLALKLREFSTAQQSFQQLLEADPGRVDAVVGLVRAKIGQDDFLGAYTELQKRLKTSPDDPLLTYWFGISAKELLKLKEATASFQKAKKLDPKMAGPTERLLEEQVDQGKLKSAIKLAKEAEKALDGEAKANVLVEHAHIDLLQRRFKDAKKKIDAALTLSPESIPALTRSVDILIALEKTREASTRAKFAELLDPKNPNVIVAKAQVLSAKGKHDEAQKLLEDAKALAPNDHRIHVRGAEIALAARNMSKAKGYLDSAAELLPKNPKVANLKGQILSGSDPKMAEREFQAAKEGSPTVPSYPYHAGLNYASMGANLEAIDDFQLAIRLDPKFADAYFQYGLVLKEIGRRSEARKKFRTVAKLDPRRADTHMEIASILASQGDAKNAIKAYDRAIRANPKNPKAICEKGMTLVQQLGDRGSMLRKGIKTLERCVARSPKHPTAWRLLGNAYRETRKKSKAVNAYQRHIKVSPSDPDNSEVCDRLADLGAPCR